MYYEQPMYYINELNNVLFIYFAFRDFSSLKAGRSSRTIASKINVTHKGVRM